MTIVSVFLVLSTLSYGGKSDIHITPMENMETCDKMKEYIVYDYAKDTPLFSGQYDINKPIKIKCVSITSEK